MFSRPCMRKYTHKYDPIIIEFCSIYRLCCICLTPFCISLTGKGKRDPEQRFRECQQRCQRQEEGQQQRQCQQRCQQEYRREIEQEHQGTGGEETNPQKREENNPYLFESHRWMTGYRSSHGHLRVLEKFTQRSELFRGIEKFRVAVAEFEPQSFMMPHHTDGEAIYIVVRGNLIIYVFLMLLIN